MLYQILYHNALLLHLSPMYYRSVVTAFFRTRTFPKLLPLVGTNGRHRSFSESFSGLATSNENKDDEEKKSRISSRTKTYELSALGKGTLVTSRTTLTGHSILTDLPKFMGGSNCYAQPVEHLLAALVSCEHVTALYVGRSMNPRLCIDRTEWEIFAVRDERGALQLPINEDPPVPSRLHQIVGQVIVHRKDGLPISREELQLLKHQTEIRCPVANMITASGCQLEITWKVGGLSTNAKNT